MPRICLLGLLFLMTFGPKVAGWLDVLSLASACFFVGYFLASGSSPLPAGAKRNVLWFSSAMSGLFAFAVAHYAFRQDLDPYQALRFGRVLLNLVGIYALVSAYYREYGRAAREALPRHIYHCLVIHAAIMLAMFCFPAFRDLVLNHMVRVDPDSRAYVARMTGSRIAGLTDSWDALSGLQSLGLLMLPILMTRQARLSYGYAVVSVVLLAFAVMVSGRTGLVTLAILLPVAVFFSDVRRLHRGLVVASVLLLSGVALIEAGSLSILASSVRETSITRSLAVFGLTDVSLETDDLRETFEAIREHYFLPEDWPTLLLGTGGSGRDAGDYVPADNGLVLNLHNLGLGGWTVLYGLLIRLIWQSLTLRRNDPASAGFCVLAVLLILLIDAKVAYAYSRNGFTIMMTLGMLVWCENRELPWITRRGVDRVGARRSLRPSPHGMRFPRQPVTVRRGRAA